MNGYDCKDPSVDESSPDMYVDHREHTELKHTDHPEHATTVPMIKAMITTTTTTSTTTRTAVNSFIQSTGNKSAGNLTANNLSVSTTMDPRQELNNLNAVPEISLTTRATSMFLKVLWLTSVVCLA